MKYGGLLLVIGLGMGFAVGYFICNAVKTMQRHDAGMSFLSGMGLGFGASVGLVLMIWLLKTCDRYLAAATQEN
jgi:hypothetical protein